MYIEELRRAVLATPRERLAEIQAALWKSHAAGAIGDDDAQALAEAIQARKAIAAAARPARRHVGSRPRSPASIERRRSWSASGWLPPQLAARFTAGEIAVLSVIAAEIATQGRCELVIEAIGCRAGVSATTVRNALREAKALGLVTVEERRLTYARNLPNVVIIVSPEWTSWAALRGRKLRQGGGCTLAWPSQYSYFYSSETPRHAGRKKGEFDGANRKARARAEYPASSRTVA